MSWMRRAGLAAMVLVVTLAHATARAEVIWIGQPTARDYWALNVRQTMENFGRLREQMAEFQADIAEARRAYFTASPDKRAAAGNRFATLLFQKDVILGYARISSSSRDQRIMTESLLVLGAGGPVDGGVPPVAAEAYANWVSAVRARAPDISMLADATDNGGLLEEYQAYRRLRDKAEADDWEATSSGKALPLLWPGRQFAARDYFTEVVYLPRFNYEVRHLDAKILRCEYGGRKIEGSTFDFWLGQAPDNLDWLIALNPQAFSHVKDHALTTCPADHLAARAAAAVRQQVHVPPEMRRRAQRAAREVPADPQRVQETRERNASALQLMKDRNGNTPEKRARYRECSEELRNTMRTANREERSAARARYDECMAPARDGGS